MSAAAKDTAPKTALVTGASSGIGYELCRLLARDGYRLVLVARDEEKLEAAAEQLRADFGVTGMICVADLEHPGAVQEIAEALADENIELDILINNAGFGSVGAFAEMEPGKVEGMIQVNVSALTRLTHQFLPGMLARGSGKIMNVASTAAFQPGPGMAVYYATKAFVLSFSLALSEEVRGSGVTVTAVCPGPTRTGFTERGGLQNSKLFAHVELMSAEKVAVIGYRALRHGKNMVVTGMQNRLGAIGTRLIPRSLAARIAQKLHEDQPGAAKPATDENIS